MTHRCVSFGSSFLKILIKCSLSCNSVRSTDKHRQTNFSRVSSFDLRQSIFKCLFQCFLKIKNNVCNTFVLFVFPKRLDSWGSFEAANCRSFGADHDWSVLAARLEDFRYPATTFTAGVCCWKDAGRQKKQSSPLFGFPSSSAKSLLSSGFLLGTYGSHRTGLAVYTPGLPLADNQMPPASMSRRW